MFSYNFEGRCQKHNGTRLSSDVKVREALLRSYPSTGKVGIGAPHPKSLMMVCRVREGYLGKRRARQDGLVSLRLLRASMGFHGGSVLKNSPASAGDIRDRFDP